MEETGLVQRVPHHHEDEYGINDPDLDDISYSSSEDSDENYGGDREDNDEFPDDVPIKKDPGPFRYNRKMVIVSLPCAVMVLTLVGELFLMACSFGAGIILIVDPKGEKKRCLILYTLLFVFCHAFTIFSILPLLWLSVLNIFLIGVVNMYVILTGGLIALQFTFLRKHETRLALMIEKMLFSVYPWCCVILLTWTSSAILHWELLPYVFIAVGFVYLQLFLTPHSSSFKIENKVEDKKGENSSILPEDDLNVIPEVISLLMAIIYCMFPAMLHVILHIVNNPIKQLFSFTVLLHLLFIISLSVFLTTLMSLRGIMEITGWPYKHVVTCRWVTGALCTLLVYPIMVHFNLSSHFLPWLPAAIAVYALYGALLSNKKFKGTSLLLLPLPCVLFAYWMTFLPWQIVLELLFGLDIKLVYFMLLINCLLCFLCMYMSSYGSETLFGLLVTVESVVFNLSEAMLYSGGFYTRPFIMFTAATSLYALHRLHMVGKLSTWPTTVSSAVHTTKAALVVIYHVIGTEDQLTVYRGATLFVLSLVVVRVISFDGFQEKQVKQVMFNIAALCAAIVINSNPILHLVCFYVLWEEPTTSDILGLGVTACGICTVLVGSLHLPTESVTAVRQLGTVCASMGVLILVLQPTISMSAVSLLQWGDVGSVVLVASVLLSDTTKTLYHLAVAAILAGVCPGLRLASMLYTYADETPAWALLVRSCLYVPASMCLIYMLFIFVKLDVVQKMLERNLLFLCSCLGMLSVMLLFIDIHLSNEKEAVMSLPAWKLLQVSTGVVSIALKILSSTQDLLIPLVEEKREKSFPRLPLIGNVASIVSFLLACIQSPVKGLLNDVWCCAASLILLALQKDNRLFTNIKQENQIVPTIFSCIAVLFVSGLAHSDLWDSGGLSFLRSLIEVLTMLSVLPMYYVLWGIMWKDRLVLPEQIVVFVLPMNAVFLLYGSSYTSQALALVGLYAGVWMMVMKLTLQPHRPDDR